MSDTLTKLQPGMIVLFDGARHRVVMVNESRARIVPMEKVETQVKQIIDGKKVVVASFSKYGAGQNISPNSEIEIVGFEKPNEQVSETPVSSVSGSPATPSLPRRGRGRPRKHPAIS
jgi:hypothetical protein